MVKDRIETWYTAEKWLHLHEQPSADMWRFHLYANELNMMKN